MDVFKSLTVPCQLSRRTPLRMRRGLATSWHASTYLVGVAVGSVKHFSPQKLAASLKGYLGVDI